MESLFTWTQNILQGPFSHPMKPDQYSNNNMEIGNINFGFL